MLRRNILLFHSGALGDFILTWPIALALARLHAQSRIFYVTSSEKGRLAEKVLGIESRDAESGWQHLFGDPGKLPESLRRTLESARLIVNFLTPETDPWVRNVHTASRGAEILTLLPRPAIETNTHLSQFLSDQLSHHRILHPAVTQMIRSVSEKGAGTLWKPGPHLLLHPGSGSREKCWPIPCWIELARRLQSAGRPVRFLLGEVERERFNSTDIAALESAAELRWPSIYVHLLDELATAAAFVGNDSGPGHLAGAIGVPTFCLFGPTNPAVWSPLGPRVHILHAQTLDEITPDAVQRELNIRFPATADSKTDCHSPE